MSWRPVYPWIAAGAGLPVLAVPLLILVYTVMAQNSSPEAPSSPPGPLWLPAAVLVIVFVGLLIVSLLSVPAAYIASLVRSGKLRQWPWVWILAGAPFACLATTIISGW